MSCSVSKEGRLAAFTAALAYLEIVGGVRRPVWSLETTDVQGAMSRRVRFNLDVEEKVVV